LVADVKHLTENQTSFHTEIKSQITDLKDNIAQRLTNAEVKLETLESGKFSKADFDTYRKDLEATNKKIDTVNNKLLYYTGGIAVLVVIAEAIFQYFISKH